MRFEDLADVHPSRHTVGVQDDVDRGAVGEERHVLDGQDLADHALVAVPAGQLVAVGDLALLGDVDPHQLVDAGGELVVVLAGEHPDADDLAGLAVRHLQRGVADFAGLLTEDRAQQPLLRSQLGLALRGDLADQDVTVADFGADAHDATLVEVGEHLIGDVRDVPGDLLGTELGVAGVDLVLLDVNRGEHVLLNQPAGQDDRVLVVVTLPGHDRDQQVAAQRHLAVLGARTVGDDLAGLHPLPGVHDRLLVGAGAVVGPVELAHPVAVPGAVVGHHGDVVGRNLLHHTGFVGDDNVTGVDRGAQFHTGAHQGRLAAHQRDGLTLHVRAHQRAVGIVVLQERDHGRGDRHHLARRDVHEVHLGGADVLDLTALAAHQNALLEELAGLLVGRRVGLRHDVAVLLVGGQVVDLIGDDPVDDLAVRRLDEPERVDPGVHRQRTDQADVRAFRGLDRAHPAVVRRVHVAHLEAGPLTGQTTGAQRRQAALVGQTGQRVVLVHELAQLRRAEELLDRRHDGADVDQGLRGDRLDVLGGHPLAHDALHAAQADPDLVLDQLAHGAQAPVAEVVDVVDLDGHLDAAGCGHGGRHPGLRGMVQTHQVLDRGDDVLFGQRRVGDRLAGVEPQLLVDLVAAHPGQVVTLLLEEQVLQQGLRGLLGRRLARAQLAVDVQQRLIGAGVLVFLQRRHHDLGEAEPLADLLAGPAERLEQRGDRLAALTVDADADGVALVDVELQPRAATGDHLDAVQGLLGGLVDRLVEVDTGRADQLADHHALGAVDDEGALFGHHREVAHEDRLALDLAGVVVDELGRDEQRGRVRHVLVFALVDRCLDLVKTRVGEAQRHRAGEVLDGRKLGEHLLQTADRVGVAGGLGLRAPLIFADQPFEGVGLDVEQSGNLQGFTQLRERDSPRGSRDGIRRVGCRLALARDCQDASFQHLMRLSGYRCQPVHSPLICVGSL